MMIALMVMVIPLRSRSYLNSAKQTSNAYWILLSLMISIMHKSIDVKDDDDSRRISFSFHTFLTMCQLHMCVCLCGSGESWGESNYSHSSSSILLPPI